MKYRTIVADPPWRYTVTQGLPNRYAGEGHGRRVKPTAEGQYATMTNADIAALPIREHAAPGCHLYLWVTNPLLFGPRDRPNEPTPIDIVRGWGFTYVTLLTWHKLGAPGMGFYFRGDTEHVIFARLGDAPIPAALRHSNHFAAQRTVHSAKPDRFYEIVERVSPEPRLELFARRRRYGWDVLGDEAPEFAASQAEMGLADTGSMDLFDLHFPVLEDPR